MKVIVDRDRCVGTGICESVASTVFEVGDHGITIVHHDNIGADDWELIRSAVSRCPAGALRLAAET